MKSKKKTDPNPYKLDAYEKDIQDAYEKGLLKPSKNAEEMKRYAKQVAENTLRKDKKINVRISSLDLMNIKALAEREGMPYQTLIASIIHKASTGQKVHFSLDDKKAA